MTKTEEWEKLIGRTVIAHGKGVGQIESVIPAHPGNYKCNPTLVINFGKCEHCSTCKCVRKEQVSPAFITLCGENYY